MYRTVAQLDSAMNFLSSFFPALCTRVEMPNRSVQGRRIFALHMHAGTATGRRKVFIVGGLHAREMMNPDAIAERLAASRPSSTSAGSPRPVTLRCPASDDSAVSLDRTPRLMRETLVSRVDSR